MKYAVIGAGEWGESLAGYLALRGFKVALQDNDPKNLSHIREGGGIELTGLMSGFARIATITTEMEEAVSGAKVIMVVTWSTEDEAFFERVSPYLTNGQIVVFYRGNFGSLEFARALKENGIEKDVIIADTESQLLVARLPRPGTIEIRSIKRELSLSAYPAKRNPEMIAVLQEAFPQFTTAQNVIQIGLGNANGAFHPPFTMFNAARIENTKGDIIFYKEGATPSVVRVSERIDTERVQVGRAFGVEVPTALDLLRKFYGAKGDSLYEAIRSVESYMKGRALITSLNSRYIWEDIPMSLVPISQLGQLARVDTFAIDTIIDMGSLLLGRDLRQNARDLKSLGLEGKSIDEIKQLL